MQNKQRLLYICLLNGLKLKKHIINNKKNKKMTKADLVEQISYKTGVDKAEVLAIVESFMTSVKTSLEKGENVYLRGFGSFIIKTRAAKIGRNISKNKAINIPAHNIPSFKPAKVFSEGIKVKVKVK